MFKSKKKRITTPVITQSLAVPIVSYSSNSSSQSSSQQQPMTVPSVKPKLNTNMSIDEMSIKAEQNRKRRRSFLASSRMSLYSLFYPSAYSNRKQM